jgi:ribosomal protein L7/L12
MADIPQLTSEQRETITQAIFAGRKIEAIKELRSVSGLGLKEAKDVVETIESELRAAQPERFTGAGAKRGCGSAVLLACLGGAATSAYFLG